MVYIITGAINSGKTAKLASLYLKRKEGDGFLIQKVFVDGNYAGQKILRLSTGESVPFSYKDGYIPASWDEKYRFDVYSFSQKGFDFAQDIIEQIASTKANPVFIDEIGPLELQGKGFYNTFMYILNQAEDIYVSVREACLKNVIQQFHIHEYVVIKI